MYQSDIFELMTSILTKRRIFYLATKTIKYRDHKVFYIAYHVNVYLVCELVKLKKQWQSYPKPGFET